MTHVEIERDYLLDRTIGEARVVNTFNGKTLFEFYTLELPWQNNQRRISCIPSGIYHKVIKHKSPKFGNSFWVQDVPNRSEILIHKGNFVRDTLGCILPGMKLGDIDKDGRMDVTSSRKCMSQLYKMLPSQFPLLIK